jgi:hypothetical protein
VRMATIKKIVASRQVVREGKYSSATMKGAAMIRNTVRAFGTLIFIFYS